MSPGTGSFQPTLAQVRDWADVHGIADDVLAELDLWLCYSVGLIAVSPLGSRLCFKGGTALNKLYFGNTARLSIDLDYNALGEERIVYRRCRELREELVALLSQAGAQLHRYNYGVSGDHLLFRYQAITTGDFRSFKIEISLTERFAVLGLVQRPLLAPSASDAQIRVEIGVNTAQLIELVATKIRALHQRRKGRDIFDIWHTIDRVEDITLLRRLVLFYFACRNISFDRRAFFSTLDQKLEDRRFQDDLTAFLRSDAAFGWKTGAADVREWLDNVLTLDEKDEEFLLLVKHLAGIAGGRKAAAVADRVDHPLLFLLGERPELSEEGRMLTTADFRRLMHGVPPDPDAGV